MSIKKNRVHPIIYILIICIPKCAKPQTPIIHIKNGYIKGIKEQNCYVFKSIPYAAPIEGAARFEKPAAHENWKDTLDCTEFGDISPQPSGNNITGGKNCLSLNVYSPVLNAVSKLPVVVWIHGGGMTNGAGKGTNGHAFSDYDSIVAVTINYRLGVFGFLELNGLGKEYASSGNNAILDCVAALTWIKTNIQQFGGDPNRITIMGESAGAKLAAALLVCRKADGLINQAILESGGVQCIHDSITADNIRKKLFGILEITNPKDILNMPTEKILHAQAKLCSGVQGTNYFGPVIDGKIFTEDPYEYILHHKKPNIKILIGSNKNEARLFMDADKRLYHPTLGSLADWFGDNGQIVYRAVQESLANTSDSNAVLIPLISQYMYQMHTYRLADAFAKSGYKTWVYRFDYSANKYGAEHGDELKYVWYIPHQKQGSSSLNIHLAEEVHQDWVNFIKNEQSSKMSNWFPYNIDDPVVKIYNSVTAIKRLTNEYNDAKFPSSVFELF